MRCWPLVLPGHREIVAAHCLPFIAAAAERGAGVATGRSSSAGRSDGGGTSILGGLARAAGPFGPAMALALAHGLAAISDRDRLAAVDAVVHLAGTDGLDAELLGRELAHLLTTGAATEGAAAALALVGRRGAWHVVWAVAHAVVPALLRKEQPPTGLPAMLAVATEAATATGARADLPEVTASAHRADGTRVSAEAARLAAAIG